MITEFRHYGSAPCPFSTNKQPCWKIDCRGCPTKVEALAKANEEIADSMRSYWANLNNGSADWRG